jgi:hypothetical protein
LGAVSPLVQREIFTEEPLCEAETPVGLGIVKVVKVFVAP